MAHARHGGVTVSYDDRGPRDAPPVVLIMGLGGSGASWYRMLPHLEGDYRLLVVDNRGTGGTSDPPLRRPLQLADMVRDIVAVLDDAGVDAAHVHGISMGGMISQQLALRHPDRVRSLALGCTTAGHRIGRQQPPWRLLVGGALGPLDPKRSWRVVEPALYARRTIEAGRDRIREDLRVRARERLGVRTVPAQLVAAAGHRAHDRLSRLTDIPVTVIHGDEDRLIPVGVGRDLASRIPGSHFVELDECGHVMSTDAEQRYADVLRAHLARAERG